MSQISDLLLSLLRAGGPSSKKGLLFLLGSGIKFHSKQ
nr:MAG TPA: hypothetical protein [Caudoviricetes sp.]